MIKGIVMAAHDALKALHHAATSGDEKAVTTLLAQDTSSWLDTSNARIALNSAIGSGNVAVVSALIAHSPSDERSNYTALNWAGCQGHRNLVVQILATWPDLVTILRAAKRGYDEVLNVMLSRDPQPLWTRARSRTALIAAVNGGHESTVALLLAKDPELIHIVNSSRQTALHCARQVSIAKQLLDHKPELIDAVDSRGWTALHSAVHSSVLFEASIEMIDFLLERKPGLNDAVDFEHKNALHLAACTDHREAFFRLLAQNPQSIDVLALGNKNILHLAARAGIPHMLDAILSLRPEFACGVDAYGNTALHCLFQGWRHSYSCWEKIWELNPCALRAVNKHLQTPSMIAIGRGFLREKELCLTQKLSWDELIADHEMLKSKRRDLREKLDRQLQISRTFAEEQCESGLSSALFIPGVIDIVKSYSFSAQEVQVEEEEPSYKRHKSEDDECWHWGDEE